MNNTRNDESPARLASMQPFVNRKARGLQLGALHWPYIYGRWCDMEAACSKWTAMATAIEQQKVQHDKGHCEALKSYCIQLGARTRAAMHYPHTHTYTHIATPLLILRVSLECEYPHSFITHSPHLYTHSTTSAALRCAATPAWLLMEPVSPSPPAGQHFVLCPVAQREREWERWTRNLGPWTGPTAAIWLRVFLTFLHIF